MHERMGSEAGEEGQRPSRYAMRSTMKIVPLRLRRRPSSSDSRRPSMATIHRNLAIQRAAPRRRLLTVFKVLHFLWNVLSPFKNWYLSIYEIANTELLMNFGVDWWTELDHEYVKFLYDQAGVPCYVAEGQPLRLINVYVDFMVLPRARRWAHGVNAWHQDPLVGRYCRSGLSANSEAQAAALRAAIHDPKYLLWGKVVTNYIPEQSGCHVNEVAEAILCLKGYNATQFMNLEWSTKLDPADPVVHAAMAEWQGLVFTNLTACISRREFLLTTVFPTDRDKALLTLADELAANYSLNPYGYAGKKNLVAVFQSHRGFIDVSGYLSGVRKVSLSGSITERHYNFYDGDMGAITAVRQAIWCCLFDADMPPAPLGACLQREGLRLPSLFMGDKLFRTREELAGQFIDDLTLVPGPPRGVDGRTMSQWNYRPTPAEPVAVTYLRTANKSGVGMTYSTEIDPRLVATHGGGATPISDTMGPIFQYKCIYEPGCASACHNNTDWTLPFFMIYAVRKSGYCYRDRMPSELIDHNGIVAERCYGIGTGSSTLLFKLDRTLAAAAGWTDPPESLEIPNVADPMAILACIMGGRVPVKDEPPFPSGFQNMISKGTGMVLTVNFGDGSEEVLANMYALLSLAGATLYASYVLVEVWRLYGFVLLTRRATDSSRITHQILYSVSGASLSFRVWRLHYAHLSFVGFFTIFSWLLGASRTQCSWYIHDRLVRSIPADEMDISAIPTYKCNAGNPLAPVSSPFEVVRLLSSAVVVFFILLGKRHMLGIGRTTTTLTVVFVFYGLVPSLLLFTIIVELNGLRLQSRLLEKIHNQLFVAVACILGLVGWKQVLPWYDRLTLLPLLRLLGSAPQRVRCRHNSGQVLSLSTYYGGNHLMPDSHQRPSVEAETWVPLSVFMEFVSREHLHSIDWRHRCLAILRRDDNGNGEQRFRSFRVTNSQTKLTPTERETADPPVPDWVNAAAEFHVRVR